MRFVPRAMEQLAAMSMGAQSEAAKLGAIKEILDRAVGKAPQAMVHSGAIGSYDLTKATDDELETLAAILGRLEASTV
ncbi:hypothetical protein XI09_19350 [Bradyrhizobium sp. CCBAU 11386]|uniref:hypothetical protein n=1 Tax=Bradyrhizobium sp. CCBAU 11386 TaxID=1630837 RepID=UPI002304B8E3|nr:hypothetical protein [Bradyrhizobium sp. CCBAU 11386]MDA9506743.1 hypothetical protein [Bradyrhizobium sp. CCBAU 11386]